MSREAEQYLIGAILLDNDLTEQVCSIVNPEDFADTTCRDLMYLCMAARAKGLAVDVIALSNIREHLSNGDSTIAAAADLQRNAPGTSNWQHMAGIVRDTAMRKAFVRALESVLDAAPNMPTSELLNRAHSALSAIAAQGQTAEVVRAFEHLKAVKDDIVERMEAGGAVNGLLTGYVDLDAILQGLRGGHMVVVAGRPGSGKTTLAMNVVENAAALGVPSLVFSLEMSGKELARRMLSSIGRIPLNCIDTGRLEDHGANLTNGVSRIKDLPVYVCDKGGLGIGQIRAIAGFQKRTNKIGCVVIDYIGLIRTASNRNSNRTQELGEISRQCKELAKELDIPVIVLAQLNREIDKTDRDPRLSDLRDSGEIEQDADVVAFVCKTQEDGIARVVVAKHRHAKPGECRLLHRGDLSRFESMHPGYVKPVEKRGLEKY